MRLLADFSERMDLPSGPIWPAFGQPGLWIAGPTEVRLAERNGVPQFALLLRRSPDIDSGPDPYGILDLTLQAVRDAAEAQAELNAVLPGVRLITGPADRVTLDLADGGAELTGSPGRVIQQLDWDAATLMETVLAGNETPLLFRGAASLRGVSPRVATAAHAESGFATRLRASLGPDEFTRDDLSFAVLGMGITEAMGFLPPVGAPEAARVAEAVTDRVISDWTSPAGRSDSSLPLYRLVDAPPEKVWDLSQPFNSERWLPLDDVRLETLQSFIAVEGMESVVKRRVLDRFPRGFHRIHLHANLPFGAPGIHFAQASVIAPPNPPNRPAPAQGSAVFALGMEEATVDLRLSLGEELAYTCEALAVIGDGAAMREVSGGARPHDGTLQVLGPAEFGVRVLNLTADPLLAREAVLTVGFHYSLSGRPVAQEYQLTEEPLTVLLPAVVESNAFLALTARQLDGDGVIELPNIPLDVAMFSQSLFPGFGLHEVLVKMEPAPVGVVAIELQRPSGQTEVFSFTSTAPERLLQYAVVSIFETNMSWRWMGAEDWQSHAHDAGPLVLDPQTAL